MEQKEKVKNLEEDVRRKSQKIEMRACKGGSPGAKKIFWSHLKQTLRESQDITAVRSPLTGELKCGRNEV